MRCCRRGTCWTKQLRREGYPWAAAPWGSMGSSAAPRPLQEGSADKWSHGCEPSAVSPEGQLPAGKQLDPGLDARQEVEGL
ncbi:unnamed protein product [Bubo scandiacus]